MADLLAENPDLVYAGEKVVLVTYETRHVATYHEWMEDEELREMTSSERLTLEEEYETREEWRNHERQGTLLILDKAAYMADPDDVGALIGDTNFVQFYAYVEVMVMIADVSKRRQGMGLEAIRLLLRHVSKFCGTRPIRAHIATNNAPSLALFQKLGFTDFSTNPVFNDVTLELKAEDLEKATEGLNVQFENEEMVEELLQSSRDFYVGL